MSDLPIPKIVSKALCKLFGHRPHGPGWWGDVPYARPQFSGVDALGTVHGSFYHECCRCGTLYRAGRFHASDPRIVGWLVAAGTVTCDDPKKAVDEGLRADRSGLR